MNLLLRSLMRGPSAIPRAIALWLAIMAAPCHAEPPPYLIDVWTPYEGLPQSRVLSIAQTPDGYLWIATQLGWLARFDGIRFAHFNPDNTSALVSPEIQKLFVDERGLLWIADIDGRLISHPGEWFVNHAADKPGYARRVVERLGGHGGENRFVTASGALLRLGTKPVYENEATPAKPNDAIRQFCQDKEGVLWCRTQGGALGRWINGVFLPEPEPSPAAGAKVNQLLAPADGGLWIATDDGLWKREAGVISRALPTLPDGGRKLLHLARNADGSLWLQTAGGVALVRDGEIVSNTALTGIEDTQLLRPLEIHADSRGGVWVLKLGAGVWHVDAGGTLTVISTRNGLPSDLVETWFEDREKNIWLGTAAGLVRLRPRWFQIVRTEVAGPGTGVVSVCEDTGGDIFIGRANGLTRWRDGEARDVPLLPVRPGFPIADVTIAPGGTPGEVWLGTVMSGAFLLRDGQIGQPFPFPSAGLAIRVVRKDPLGGIWFGGEYGLFRWDGAKLRKFGPQDGLRPGHIHDISFDSNGDAWIAKAEDILCVYRGGRFEAIPMPGISRTMRVHTVLCGSEGSVWLGTVGAGLLHLSHGKLFRYTSEDGLPGNSITQLLEDGGGYLWGGTHQGIFRVSTAALDMRSKGVRPPALFQNYSHADGLPTAECPGGLQPACWKANDGHLWFTTSAAAIRINPEQLGKNVHPPSVIVERMLVDEKSANLDAANADPARLSVAPGSHRYEFQFTGISFTAPAKVRFQWRLGGVDDDWVDGHARREVAYNSLGPGDYRFSVRACNNDGVWSPEPAAIVFRVEPFLWQRPVVRAGFAAATLAAVYLLIAGILRRKHFRALRHLEYEHNLEQQRFRHKQAMETERARIAAELHDDLGANLTQIQWLGEAANRARDPGGGENEILTRISHKCREMVRLIDEIVWAVNPKNDTLEQLVTYVCNFAEQYFRDTDTRCRIDVATGIPTHTLEADVRHHLFLIAKEALHNVAKHADTDRVWVRVNCADGVFRLVIEDRGRGFQPDSSADGDGLSNMRRRARTAGAELTIDSAPGKGTQIVLVSKLNPPTA